LCASTTLSAEVLERFPTLAERARRFMRYHSELVANIAAPDRPGVAGRRLLSGLNETKLRRVLGYLFDERELLRTYRPPALVRDHIEHPHAFALHGEA